MGRREEPHELTRALTELRVVSAFALSWGAAGLAALFALERASDVLLGGALGALVMLAVWFPATSRARQRKHAGQPGPPPSEARVEGARETVRRAVTQGRLLPVFVVLIVAMSLLYGPTPGTGAILASATMGTAVGGGLECLRRAIRLARWERTTGHILLYEPPARRRSLRRRPRRVFTSPSPREGRS
jgi:hypothetical protein